MQETDLSGRPEPRCQKPKVSDRLWYTLYRLIRERLYTCPRIPLSFAYLGAHTRPTHWEYEMRKT